MDFLMKMSGYFFRRALSIWINNKKNKSEFLIYALELCKKYSYENTKLFLTNLFYISVPYLKKKIISVTNCKNLKHRFQQQNFLSNCRLVS